MLKKIKISIAILVAIILLIGSLCLVLTPAGMRLQAKILGTYIPTDAIADTTFVAEYEAWGKSAGNHIHEARVYLKVKYVIDGQNYIGKYNVKAFPYYERKEAKKFAKKYIVYGTHITIYRDPKKPAESVLHAEDEMHLVLNYLTLLIITILTIFILIMAGFLFSKEQSAQVVDSFDNEQ